MREFLDHLIKQLVSNPDAVSIEEQQEGDYINFMITVAQEDMGLVIGREGNTINSIRNLAKAKAIKDNIRVRIQLNEVNADN